MLPLLIQRKQKDIPFQATSAEIAAIRTPVNATPYSHMFQGNLGCVPSAFARRAGWSPQIYERVCEKGHYYPEHCWQSACNTIFTYEKKDNKCVKKECINLYR